MCNCPLAFPYSCYDLLFDGSFRFTIGGGKVRMAPDTRYYCRPKPKSRSPVAIKTIFLIPRFLPDSFTPQIKQDLLRTMPKIGGLLRVH